MNHIYKRQNQYKGAFFFVFSREKFVQIAVEDGMARNLEADDQRKRAEEKGAVQLQKWEKQYRKDYSEMAAEISSALWSSFGSILLLSVICLAAAFYAGSVSIALEFHPISCMAYLGSALVGWAAMMELGNDFMVWDGPAYPQIVHNVLFKLIFIPGVFLVLLSILL
jgi:hypothetical protein